MPLSMFSMSTWSLWALRILCELQVLKLTHACSAIFPFHTVQTVEPPTFCDKKQTKLNDFLEYEKYFPSLMDNNVQILSMIEHLWVPYVEQHSVNWT